MIKAMTGDKIKNAKNISKTKWKGVEGCDFFSYFLAFPYFC